MIITTVSLKIKWPESIQKQDKGHLQMALGAWAAKALLGTHQAPVCPGTTDNWAVGLGLSFLSSVVCYLLPVCTDCVIHVISPFTNVFVQLIQNTEWNLVHHLKFPGKRRLMIWDVMLYRPLHYCNSEQDPTAYYDAFLLKVWVFFKPHHSITLFLMAESSKIVFLFHWYWCHGCQPV